MVRVWYYCVTASVKQLMQVFRRGWGRVPVGVRVLSEASAIPGPQIADLKHKLMDGLEYYETIAASAVSELRKRSRSRALLPGERLHASAFP